MPKMPARKGDGENQHYYHETTLRVSEGSVRFVLCRRLQKDIQTKPVLLEQFCSLNSKEVRSYERTTI